MLEARWLWISKAAKKFEGEGGEGARRQGRQRGKFKGFLLLFLFSIDQRAVHSSHCYKVGFRLDPVLTLINPSNNYRGWTQVRFGYNSDPTHYKFFCNIFHKN